MFHFVIHRLIELGDSIGQDLANQARTPSAAGLQCRTFAEVYKRSLYPELNVESIERLPEALDAQPAPIIYHWCDGWHDLDTLFVHRRAPLMVPQHYNTSPGFFAPYSPDATSRTLRGRSGILRIVDSSDIRVLANSHFSAWQLEILGIAPCQIRVVYPMSEYLRGPRARDASAAARRKLPRLFVGRTAPHKAHRHFLRSAAALRAKFGIHCRLLLPGRMDRSMLCCAGELRRLARKLGVELALPGEVENRQLEQIYVTSDFLVCLPEHEDSGLPVIEAMRAQLPVVGYRSSAVAETLGDHPLALDSLDYGQIAARIAGLADSDVSRDVVVFQNDVLLPRFSSELGANQFPSAVGAAKEFDSAGVNGAHAIIPPRRVSSVLQRALGRLAPSAVRAQQTGGAGNRDVTLNVIRAYEGLLAQGGRDSGTLGLRDACMNISFHSPRPLVGRLVDKFKRISRHLQDGVVHQSRNCTPNLPPGSIGSSPASIGCPPMMPLRRHSRRIPAARAVASHTVMSTRVKVNRTQSKS